MKRFFVISLLIGCFIEHGSALGAAVPQSLAGKSVVVQNPTPQPPTTAKTAASTSAKIQKVQSQLPQAFTKTQVALPIQLKPISAVNGQKIEPHLSPAVAQGTSPVQPQKVDFKSCNKYFKMPSQKLFYFTLASVNANKFTIDEIQSKSGYILFSVGKKHFLASIISIDSKNSLLKITPCDNTYYFPVGIVQNMFKYIELNIQTPVEQLNVL